ncbi:MAG: putative membrane protein [Parcubacteria bacterium C7867-008]|nr:MAG: putative membrane protein [Parcubacteria bacterium C7867-008]
MNDLFRKLAQKTSRVTGSPTGFIIAILFVLIWAASGPLFNFSNTWQLVINTGTTILTFLMVFLIQNTQNRDAHAINLKLDEIIRSSGPARDEFIDIEDGTDEKLAMLTHEFNELRKTINEGIIAPVTQEEKA